MVKRGQIWWADIGEPRGSAPAYRRPVVVVQADTYNKSRLATTVAVVVTSNLRLAAMPGNVFLPSSATGLRKDSVANVTQVATLDRDNLEDLVGELPLWLFADVERGLRRVLGLP